MIDEDEFDDIDHYNEQETCRAIYDYIPKQQDELALKEGTYTILLYQYS